MALSVGTPYTNGKPVTPVPQALPVMPEPEIFNAKEVVSILQDLMTKVTQEQVTPATVQAACQCASQISHLLRLHLDAERLRRQPAR